MRPAPSPEELRRPGGKCYADRIVTKLIVALDRKELWEALRLVELLHPYVEMFAVGQILFSSQGPEVIRHISREGGEVLLDLKCCDIPEVTERVVGQAWKCGVSAITIHALGGKEMMHRAAAVHPRPLIWAVTVLTSLEERDLAHIGLKGSVEQEVVRLAANAVDCGLDGVVTSAHELAALKRSTTKDLPTIVPGIRWGELAEDDQKRTSTPADAAKLGADYLIIGRPIIDAKDPVKVTLQVLEELNKKSSSPTR